MASKPKKPIKEHCTSYPGKYNVRHTLAFHMLFFADEKLPPELQGGNAIGKFEIHLHQCRRCASLMYGAALQITEVFPIFLLEGLKKIRPVIHHNAKSRTK